VYGGNYVDRATAAAQEQYSEVQERGGWAKNGEAEEPA